MRWVAHSSVVSGSQCDLAILRFAGGSNRRRRSTPVRRPDVRSAPTPAALFRWVPSLNSGDDADAASPAQLFDAGDEITIWKHIIAFRFHHHHEIALAFHVK